MSQKIRFYDIPSTVGPWSGNTWKVRYALNYKGLAYETVWVEYPDIESVCKKLGVTPTEKKADGRDHYTLPVIHDLSTDTSIADSLAIVEYLDATYPSTPTVIPDGQATLQSVFPTGFRPIVVGKSAFNIIVPGVFNILNPASQVYFRETREAVLGKKMEELSPPGPIREQLWADTKAGFDAAAAWLKRDEKNPYIGGNAPTFADFVVASVLQWYKRALGADSQEWLELLSWDDGRWLKVLEALKQYE